MCAFSVDAVTAAPSARLAGSLGAGGGVQTVAAPSYAGARTAVILLLTPRLLINSRGGGFDLSPLYVSLSPSLQAPPFLFTELFPARSARRNSRLGKLPGAPLIPGF